MEKSFIYFIQTPDTEYMKRGWGNGYVALPEGHKYFGVDYNSIEVDVHGGLTFSQQIGNYWVVGFDTAHWNDNKENCTMQYCLEQVRSLQEQLG